MIELPAAEDEPWHSFTRPSPLAKSPNIVTIIELAPGVFVRSSLSPISFVVTRMPGRLIASAMRPHRIADHKHSFQGYAMTLGVFVTFPFLVSRLAALDV